MGEVATVAIFFAAHIDTGAGTDRLGRQVFDQGRFYGNKFLNDTVASLVRSIGMRVVAGYPYVLPPGKFEGCLFCTNHFRRKLCIGNFLDLDGFANRRVVLVARVDCLYANLDGVGRRRIRRRRNLHHITTRGIDCQGGSLSIDECATTDGPVIRTGAGDRRHGNVYHATRAYFGRGRNSSDGAYRRRLNGRRRNYVDREIALVARIPVNQQVIVDTGREVTSNGNRVGCATGRTAVATDGVGVAIGIQRDLYTVADITVGRRSGKSGRRSAGNKAQPLLIFNGSAETGWCLTGIACSGTRISVKIAVNARSGANVGCGCLVVGAGVRNLGEQRQTGLE